MLNRISIKDGVCIDGVEVKALKEVNINSDIDNISEVTIKFLAKVEGLDTVDKSPTYKRKQLLIDVNGTHVLQGVTHFRIARDSVHTAAIEVEEAEFEDYQNTVGNLTEFWFADENGGNVRYTRAWVTSASNNQDEIIIDCQVLEEHMFFVDAFNNKTPFKNNIFCLPRR